MTEDGRYGITIKHSATRKALEITYSATRAYTKKYRKRT